MNNRHKYFRNQRYKQSLEARYNQFNGKDTNLYFITKEVDPRSVRESNNFYLRNPDLDPIEWEKANGREYYISWKRPEVIYSVQEYSHGRNAWKQLMKYQTRRRIRRIKITEDDVAWREKNFYKKYEDRWNYD